ncbi:hypothetical protein N752_04535 [Desulforamulus aquiferis]|nr:radical SAM protein [Desulforamulus aquiferis]RYD06160.1 hypothetical protein N752_04535 [Desulforamulus aquiferis]
MKDSSSNVWLDQIVDFVGEYRRSTPGYSPRELADNLQQRFLLTEDTAWRLTELIQQETSLGKLGLAAIELNLTFNCNLTCEYCFVHRKSPTDRMSFETAKKAVDLLIEKAAFSSIIITLIGGEPLLEYELIKKIVPYAEEAAGKGGLKVTWALTTNGTLIDEDILKFFAQHKINAMISIDGGPKTHDRYRVTRSGEGSWAKIAQLIPTIKKYQPWLGARMTVSTEAIDTMREDFHHIVNLGINQLIIAPAQGETLWDKGQIEKYGLNLMDILQDYHKLKQQGVPILLKNLNRMKIITQGGAAERAVLP